MDLISLDRQIFFLINHGLSNAVCDKVMPFVTARGYLLLLPYVFYLLSKGYKERNDGRNFLSIALWTLFISFASFLLTDWATTEIKNLIGRVRPCNTLAGVNLLVGCTGSYSLPSNHASNAFAFALPLFYFMRGYIPPLPRLYPVIIAFLIAFSRVYVGVHYPSDIIAGALLGIFVGFTVIGLYKYASLRYKSSPHATLLFSFLFAIGIFRIYYILHGPLDLGPDEAHYWEWSRRLDLSYYSKGPMIAYLIYIGTSIFGDNIFGIRIMAIVFSALSSIYMFKLVRLMYADKQAIGDRQKADGNSVALLSALLLQIIPLFAPFGVIFTIDSPFIFFWTLSLYLFWKALFEGQRAKGKGQREWFFLGIVVGLGLLTKYTMAFFYLCAVLFLLFSEKRHLLKTFRPYAALLISLAVFSPVIIWNFQNDWVTIKHTAGQAHVSEGIKLSLKTFVEFLGSQIGIITPIIFFMMFYSFFKLGSRGRSQGANELLQAKFLFWFSVPVIAFFLLKSIQGKVQPNWAMTGYITGVIAFARYFKPSAFGLQLLAFKTQHLSRIPRYLAISGIGLALLVTVISHYPSIINLPAKLDPSSRLRGWKELGIEVSKIYDALSEKGEIFIFSDRYQVSSELAFYVKGQPRTYSVNLGRRMNQYDLWPDMNNDASKIRQNKGSESAINGIFVTIDDASMQAELAGAFDRFERKFFQVYDRGRLLREYSIFICYNFKGLKTVTPETY